VRLRTATDDDLDEVVGLAVSVGLENWSVAGLSQYVTGRRHDFRVLEDPKRLVFAGFYLATFLDEEMELLAIAVRPTFQGRGLGRLLLEAACEEGLLRRASRCFLEVSRSNFRAIDLYTRNGFVLSYVRTNYYGPGNDGLVLVKNL